MPRVYELPTHLQVEDQLLAGLTARQLLRLVIGASLAYGVWDQMSWLPEEVRVALAGALAFAGVLFALVQPFGGPLDQWLLAGLLFVVLPRRLVWQPGLALPGQSVQEDSGWAELELRPEWLGAEMPSNIEESRPRTAFRARLMWRRRRP
jgi:PrgI family protein